MIQLTHVGKSFAHKLLFEDVDWMVGPKDRIGLVGANGTGKTTLLLMLAGHDQPDAGSISRTRGISAGYLPQEGLRLSGRTVFAECMSVFAELRAIEEELEELTHRMSDLDSAGAEYKQVTDRFHTLDSEFRNRDGYAIEAQVGTVISGLGFAKQDWTRHTEEFSGGWQMRIALAKLLLEKPNLLLLDEPTNHLDLEARNWLEDYLSEYPHAYLLVSHDRYFLDVTISKIVEIWNKRTHFYTGNYAKFLDQRDQRRAQLEAAHRNQQERIQQLEAFISRFRYQATKARQVQSRIKELEKIERIEVPPEEKTIHFKFPQPKPSGRIVAEFAAVSKSYGSNRVLEDVNFVIERGDRIALVGVNGAGKSTLMKLLAGVEPLSAGEYRLGHNATPNYFAQDQYRELDPNTSLLDELSTVAPQWTLTELRNLLGCFLFSEDDVYKRIGVLSGGERNRYALGRLLVAPSNFILLDEPTNHLDMRAKDVLLNALEGYTGTVVFVSHDRYFIDKLATRIFEVADGHVTVFPGNYEDYIWRKEKQQEPDSPAVDSTPEVIPLDGAAGPKPKRVNPILLRQLKERCGTLESGISRAEADIAQYEGELAIFKSVDETRRVSALLAERRRHLDALMLEWEEVSVALSDGEG